MGKLYLEYITMSIYNYVKMWITSTALFPGFFDIKRIDAGEGYFVDLVGHDFTIAKPKSPVFIFNMSVGIA